MGGFTAYILKLYLYKNYTKIDIISADAITNHH